MKTMEQKYRLIHASMNHTGTSQLEAVATLDQRSLTITQDGGGVISIPYYEILEITDEDYTIDLSLTRGRKHRLSQLGYEYENFLNNLYKRKNELLLEYMLMEEECVASQIGADYRYLDEEGEEQQGHCEARIYESAIVVLPERSQPIRVPLCYISSYNDEDYLIVVNTEHGQRLELGMMGEKTDYFYRSLKNALNDAETRAQRLLSEMAPTLDPNKIREASKMMRDGRAASRLEIESISKSLWRALEDKITTLDLGEEYKYLTGTSAQSDAWIGVKRGLMGERTGDYLWFMVPKYSGDLDKPGNLLAVEATSEGGTGRATYFFRILDEIEYRKLSQVDMLRREIEKSIEFTNRCMIEINFRREPIYLTEDKLTEPEYNHHLYAANNLKPLKYLRSHYLGRVMHVSLEQWKRDVDEIQRKNGGSPDKSTAQNNR
jgi:hypothetical protein